MAAAARRAVRRGAVFGRAELFTSSAILVKMVSLRASGIYLEGSLG